jgi:1,4-dihydroxy-2-naphthoate octaprenyltransferase
MTVTRALWLTARPKTLAASIVPVLVGSTLVFGIGQRPVIWVTLFALLSATMIQVGTNFVNDALDFLKGADGHERLGEARASQQGWFTPRRVLGVGFLCFAAAIAFGAPLVWAGGWPILVIGLVSLLMGYAYTGGPFPLAYAGLGDLFVIVFFGLVAVGGVFFLETGSYNAAAAVAGLQVGLLATVLIAINNLRDHAQDALVNKKTLAVRLGPKLGRYEVVALFAAAFLLNIFWLKQGLLYAGLLPWLALPLALDVTGTLLRTDPGRSYNGLLARSALVHIVFGALLSAGFYLR